MHTAAKAELPNNDNEPLNLPANLKIVKTSGRLAAGSSLLAPREFSSDKTWLAQFRPKRSDSSFKYVPHTLANDILMNYSPSKGSVEVGYQSSALIVDILQGRLDTDQALRIKEEEPPDRRFSFITVDGTPYTDQKLIALPTLEHTKTAIKHVAVFEEFAVKVDDIYNLSLSPSD
jgi:hypothetical protein